MFDHQYDFTMTRSEIECLLQADLLPDLLRLQLERVHSKQEGKITLLLTAEAAFQLRDDLIDRISISGFDKNYELSEEGKILESLIDRLWSICGAR